MSERPPILPFDVRSGNTVKDVLEAMEQVSFQGRMLGAAFRVWREMLAQDVYIFFGLAGAMIPAMNAMVASFVPRTRLGQAYGFTTTASALGWAVGPVLGGWAASVFGYRLPFVLTGTMLLLVALAQQRSLRTGAAELPGKVRN